MDIWFFSFWAHCRILFPVSWNWGHVTFTSQGHTTTIVIILQVKGQMCGSCQLLSMFFPLTHIGLKEWLLDRSVFSFLSRLPCFCYEMSTGHSPFIISSLAGTLWGYYEALYKHQCRAHIQQFLKDLDIHLSPLQNYFIYDHRFVQGKTEEITAMALHSLPSARKFWFTELAQF